jgi:hypothetical protein
VIGSWDQSGRCTAPLERRVAALSPIEPDLPAGELEPPFYG